MDPESVAAIRNRVAKETTEALVAAYAGHSGWNSEETLEAIRQILVERCVQDASIDLKPKEGNERFAQEVEEILARGIRTFWGRRWPRFGLWLLHLFILMAAFGATPEGYHRQLGASTGLIIVLGTPLLWFFLYFARERKPIFVFCALVLVQAGIVAAVGMHYRAQDAVLQQMMAEVPYRRAKLETEMAKYRMDALFEYLNGGPPLRSEELSALKERARTGKGKALELQTDNEEWLADVERRLAEVSLSGAKNFRRGVQTSRPKADKTMQALQNYFSEIDRLIAFLLERQGRYRVTTDGPVFDVDEDAEWYDRKIDSIVHLEEQLESVRQEAEELLREVPGTQ